VLFNITGGQNLTLFEVNQAAAMIRETSHPDVNMIFGAVIEPDMGDEVRVTVIATGFERSGVPRRALERLTTRSDKPLPRTVGTSIPAGMLRPSEPVSVEAEFKPAAESKQAPVPPTFSSEDLDIPTFLRNRR
jgi:cell division protein FtsZ